MSRKVNKTAVGIFMIGALVLAVAAVILLGSGKFFRRTVPVVMYFEGSVQGLNVGSPVVYHGVKVGEVTGVRIVFDPRVMKAQIPVYAELVQGSMQASDALSEQQMKTLQKNPGLFARQLVAKGLRAQLQTQSFVTGQLMVGLDFFPDEPAKVAGKDSKHIEIPTVRSPLEQMQQKIAQIPVEELVQKLVSAVDSINGLVSSREVRQIMKSTSQGVDDIRQLVKSLDSQITPVVVSMKSVSEDARKLTGRLDASLEPLTNSIKKTSDEASAALTRANRLIAKMDDLTAESPIVLYRFTRAMEEMEDAARSIRVLGEYLEKQPDALIWGKRSIKEVSR